MGFAPKLPLGLSAPDSDLLFSLMKKVSKKITAAENNVHFFCFPKRNEPKKRGPRM